MKKLAIKYQLTGDLEPYQNNARTHSPEQVAQIVASIQEFGWTNPILLDGSNGVVAGHGRLLAAKELGLARIPCIDLDGLSEAQKRAYVIADNRLAENAGWDFPLLTGELGRLRDDGFDIELAGFSGEELEGLFARAAAHAGQTDPDDAPEVSEVVVATTGDVWLCGRHRVACGDSTVATDVAALLGDVEPHLMVTDPPYGVEYDPAWRDEAAKHSPSMGNRKDTAKGRVVNDDQADWADAWALFPGDVAYIWCASLMLHRVAESLIRSKFNLRALIIWEKNHITVGRGDYQWKHETCWYAVRKNRKGHYIGGRKQTTIWQIDKPQKSDTGHSTQKPVECMRRPIVNNSNPGQAVYDPFLGSGTTMIAAEMEARSCYGMEIAPQYVDVCVRRWQDFTGEAATLEANGKTFKQVARKRGKSRGG